MPLRRDTPGQTCYQFTIIFYSHFQKRDMPPCQMNFQLTQIYVYDSIYIFEVGGQIFKVAQFSAGQFFLLLQLQIFFISLFHLVHDFMSFLFSYLVESIFFLLLFRGAWVRVVVRVFLGGFYLFFYIFFFFFFGFDLCFGRSQSSYCCCSYGSQFDYCLTQPAQKESQSQLESGGIQTSSSSWTFSSWIFESQWSVI